MPLDPKTLEKVFANHFDNLSPDEFRENLNKACPYLVDFTSSQLHTNNSQFNLTRTENVFDIYDVFESLSVLAGSDEFIFVESIASYDQDIEELEKLCRRYISMHESTVCYKNILCEDGDLDRYTCLEKKIECQEILMKSLADRIYFQEQSMIGIRECFSQLNQIKNLDQNEKEILGKNLIATPRI